MKSLQNLKIVNFGLLHEYLSEENEFFYKT